MAVHHYSDQLISTLGESHALYSFNEVYKCLYNMGSLYMDVSAMTSKLENGCYSVGTLYTVPMG